MKCKPYNSLIYALLALGGNHGAPPPAADETVNTSEARLNANPRVKAFVVLAHNNFDASNANSGGDVRAEDAAAGPFLSGDVAIDVGDGLYMFKVPY
jgi:hypothetical protein